MKNRVEAAQYHCNKLVVGIAVLQSLTMAVFLLLSGYDSFRQTHGQSHLAFSAGHPAWESGAVGRQDGLRHLSAVDKNARSKARLIDPPDFASCDTPCVMIPRYSADLSAPVALLFLPCNVCHAFQPRAPPAVII